MSDVVPASATLKKDGERLVFAGHLDRSNAPALWQQASAQLTGIQRIVLQDVTGLDSAGLALLAEISARLRAAGTTPVIEGNPPGLSELRAAYRLSDVLA